MDDNTKKARDAAIAEVERVAALNAQGFVARTYSINDDAFVWVYGGLRITGAGYMSTTSEVDQYFKLGKNDDRIGWESFKGFLLQRKPK